MESEGRGDQNHLLTLSCMLEFVLNRCKSLGILTTKWLEERLFVADFSAKEGGSTRF